MIFVDCPDTFRTAMLTDCLDGFKSRRTPLVPCDYEFTTIHLNKNHKSNIGLNELTHLQKKNLLCDRSVALIFLMLQEFRIQLLSDYYKVLLKGFKTPIV